jgi:glycosyltransferase involved in cell wall biosynthesis
MNNKHIADFAAANAATAITIDNPFFFDPDRTPVLRIYRKGVPCTRKLFPLPRFLAKGGAKSPRILYPLFKFLDFFCAVFFLLDTKKRIDVYVGTESIDTLAGLLLKKLGRVSYVIYYMMGPFPLRYSARKANSLFLAVDKYCSERADVIWQESEGFGGARERLWAKKFTDHQITLPSLCVTPDRENSERDLEHAIVFLGGLPKESGVQIVIRALPQVVRIVPGVRFHVIGTGSFSKQLFLLARELHVSDRVIFHGFLADDEVEKIMASCKVAVAPYLPSVSEGGKFFDSSKTKYYAAVGVPVVLSTAASALAPLVRKFNSGLVSNPESDAFGTAIGRLLTDAQLYEQCRKGCRSLSKLFDANSILEEAFRRSLQWIGGASRTAA